MKRTIVFARRMDGWILACVFLLSFTIWLLPWKKAGDYATVTVQGTMIATLDLSTDREAFTLDGAGGFVFCIDHQTIAIVEAPCRNHVCVHSPAIGKEGQTIVCLPFQLVITIGKASEAPPDVII